MPGPRVAVIIPNWNGAHLLRPCLASLLAQTYDDFEVIVVDNASHDESLALIEREFPTVRTLALSTNGGYSGGCNAGIQHSQAEIVVMLNNDTEAEPDWLAHLIAGLDRHPEAGMATSRIMLYDRRDILNAAGDLYRRDGTPDCAACGSPTARLTIAKSWSLAVRAGRWRCDAPCSTRSGCSRPRFSCIVRTWT